MKVRPGRYNSENQNTEVSNLVDLALEILQNESGRLNDSNLSYATPETSRSPHVYMCYPESTGPYYPFDSEILTRRRHSSSFSINSRCETPCDPRSDSEASYPGSESFDLDNVERLSISFQDSAHLFNSNIQQSVPEMLGVQNSQFYSNSSEPAQDYTRNNGPPPPYHFPHVKEPVRSNVQRRGTSSFSSSRRNIVQDFSSPPYVAENAATSQETDTEALLRLFGRGQTKATSSVGAGNVHLWQFLLQLLADSRNSSIICWEGNDGEFKLVQPDVVAAKWGDVKNNSKMSYDNLSRSLRYYYDKKMMAKSRSKKFVYQFLKEGILAELRTPKIPDSEFIQQYCKRV
ncbi:DNA-binding protein D-ETS-3 [Araneus ventricosus]|uniref:DNA-binding protein D-ETS-3 n=1 Tax=Araneus ventricosus TaxID=182803 RepID=A0A4Y2GTU2_ARAVE|nr:DNA-binding protein D-ETS-3 [Araneus ventricosus]